MKEYKLQEEELIASFKANNPNQPTPYPQPNRPPQPQPHALHRQPSPQYLPTAPPNITYNQHYHPHMTPQPIYAQTQQQQVVQQERRNSPPVPVVFSYAENQPLPPGFYQRESIVQTVGVPARQPISGPQSQAVQAPAVNQNQ